MSAFLAQMRADQYSIFVVSGALPAASRAFAPHGCLESSWHSLAEVLQATSEVKQRGRFRAEAAKGWFEGSKPVFSYRNLNISTSAKGKLDFGVFRQQQRHMDGVAEAFRNGTEVTCTGEVGRRDMVIVEGIYESIRTGKKVELKYS
jgi:hypothetical protein